MEFQKVRVDMMRLCSSSVCPTCPLGSGHCGIESMTPERVAIVEKWVKDHPPRCMECAVKWLGEDEIEADDQAAQKHPPYCSYYPACGADKEEGY